MWQLTQSLNTDGDVILDNSDDVREAVAVAASDKAGLGGASGGSEGGDGAEGEGGEDSEGLEEEHFASKECGVGKEREG